MKSSKADKKAYRELAFIVFIMISFLLLGYNHGLQKGKQQATERETAKEKTPGLVVISDKVLTMDELDRICEIVESGGRRIVEIRSLLDDEIQYRIRFKNNKEEK